MKIFDAQYLYDLTGQASVSSRLRQHRNVHQSCQDASQLLFNASEPPSYIRLHGMPRAPVTFDQGAVTSVLRFGTDRHGGQMAVGAEVSPSNWHTVIAWEHGCVLLEVNAGPFDPNQPRDLAQRAPEESSDASSAYLVCLLERVKE
jgi:hypothetical protein